MAYLKELNHQFFKDFLNKFLKHVFNIVLKLKYSHLKKSIKSIFCGKNDTQISVFAVAKKALRAYLCRYDLRNGVQKHF